METQVDLRTYVSLLIKRWWFIVGLAALAAAAALGICLLQPPQYQAEALVVFTMPKYVASFDPRLESVDTIFYPYRAFPALATSDTVLVALQEAAQRRWPAYAQDMATLDAVRGMVQARSGLDTSMVILGVQAGGPQEAADLANAWGEIFVAQAREIYGSSSTSAELAYFEQQLASAEDDLERAEAALLEFMGRDETEVLDGQRNSLLETQRAYLRETKAAEDLVRDLREFQGRLDQYAPDTPGELGDELTALFLQVKAYNASASIPIQLQLSDPQAITSRSVAELQTVLEDLATGLGERQAAISASLSAIGPQVLDLQHQIQLYEGEGERLDLDRNVARETYQALSRKVAEVRLAVEAPGDVHLASQAAVPQEPYSPRPLRNTVVAGTAGGLLAVFVLLAREWWRSGRTPSAKQGKAA